MRITDLIFIFISLVSFVGSSTSNAAEWVTRDYCDLTIAFPDKPRVRKVSTFGLRGTSYEYQHSEILRAEFLSLPERLTGGGAMEHEDILSNYAIANGFQNWYVSLHLNDDLPHAFVRGNKVIDGKQVVYKLTLYIREQCALVVAVATLASMYPTNWISDFERSVQMR